MFATASTSWPGNKFTVAGDICWAESATATARWRSTSASLTAPLTWAKGCWGATTNTNGSSPRGNLATPGGVVTSAPTPMAMSAWPLIKASQVPAITSVRRRSRVPGPPALAPLPAACGLSAKKASHKSIRVVREMMSSMTTVSRPSQPVATRRTRLATASISSNRRRPSASSSLPAAVSCA